MSNDEMFERLEYMALMMETGRTVELINASPRYAKAIRLVLKTHPDAQPNEPLAPEELREIHEPVWVSVPRLKNGGYWCLCNGGTIIPPSCQEFDARDVKDWVFYRRPPKET